MLFVILCPFCEPKAPFRQILKHSMPNVCGTPKYHKWLLLAAAVFPWPKYYHLSYKLSQTIPKFSMLTFKLTFSSSCQERSNWLIFDICDIFSFRVTYEILPTLGDCDPHIFHLSFWLIQISILRVFSPFLHVMVAINRNGGGKERRGRIWKWPQVGLEPRSHCLCYELT